MKTTSTRPLGPCSDYLLEELPSLVVNGNHPKLMEASYEAVQPALNILERGDLTQQDARLAHLDLHMIAAALRRQGIALSPDMLLALSKIDQISGLEPGLTYQDLILSNPLETDPRSFLGEEGDHERLFYQIHRNIERHAASAIAKIRSATSASVEEAVTDLDSMCRELARFPKELPGAAFARIRPFFANDEIPGPSAKYSAGIAALDGLCIGSHPEVRNKLQIKLEEAKLYPNTTVEEDGFAGRVDMQRALEATHEMDLEHLRPLAKKLKHFRQIHYGVVAHFLPGVLLGTAGEMIRPYLQGFINAVGAALSFKSKTHGTN